MASKILKHPDRKGILRMMSNGRSVRHIEKYLKEKYPDNKKMHLSKDTIQKFRKEHMDLEGDVLKKIQETRREKDVEVNKNKISSQVKKTNAYQEKLEEIIDMHVDLKKEITQLLGLAKARMEDMYNKAANGELSTREESNLQGYFNIVFVSLEKWAKYIEGIADRKIETNVNITVIEDQMVILRSVIQETIAEFDPDTSARFLERLNERMNMATYSQNTTSFKDLRQETKQLGTQIYEMEDGDDYEE